LVVAAKIGIVNAAEPAGLNNLLVQISHDTIKPIERYLKKGTRLIVVTDGYLSGLPISILSKSKTYSPLVVEHDIKLLPSLAYRMSRVKRATAKHSANTRDLFALGDPAYSGRSTRYAADTSAEGIYRQRTLEVLKYVTPLPETRAEIDHIARLFPSDRVKVILGAAATESNVKSTALNGYRYLHFATHGVLGNQIESVYEPALVMAYEASSQDGFLTMSEVEDLEFSAELAVLSACDTGSGEMYTGEGVMGLGRSFLLAGSDSVLVSLWPVASLATVEFMRRFYSYMASGLSKPQILRQTQIDFLTIDRKGKKKSRGVAVTASGDMTSVPAKWQHPYFWAPFVLVGY
jgi:CHAT domain-containing protein